MSYLVVCHSEKQSFYVSTAPDLEKAKGDALQHCLEDTEAGLTEWELANPGNFNGPTRLMADFDGRVWAAFPYGYDWPYEILEVV